MGSEALLQMACELSYVIARDGVESDPPLEAPAEMRGYLYSAEMTPEAAQAAREAVEADSAFRRRVAEQASQDQVGRGGYIWLHRPIGWAAEFEELSAAGADHDEPAPLVELVPAIAELPDLDTGIDENRAELMGSVEGVAGVQDQAGRGSASPNEADAIEDELTSLRGLVDRLANERKAVSSSVGRVEQQVVSARQQPSGFDGDIYSLRSELESANGELEAARQDRDHAVQQHSAALTRQLELEKELNLARERQADIERGHFEADTRMVEIEEALARSEASLGPLSVERDTLIEKVDELTAKSAGLSEEIKELTQQNRAAIESAADREAELRAEADVLRVERSELDDALASTRAELGEASEQLELMTSQATEAKALVDVLTEEKIEVASRLADTEVMLDNTRTQLGAVKSDLGAVSADLAAIKTHRDGLSSQVEELHGSLGEALGNLAKVRAVSDADRSALKEVRTERDLLKVRLSSLEQVEAGLEAKLESVVSERDGLMAKIEESTTEFGDAERQLREASEAKATLDAELDELRAANTDLASASGEAKTEVEELRSQMADVESARDGLANQVEQLTAENSAIQDQLVESDRLRVETSESQGHALSELAHRLAIVEDERARIATDLSNARKALERAQSATQQSTLDPAPVSSGQVDADEAEPTAVEDTDVVHGGVSVANPFGAALAAGADGGEESDLSVPVDGIDDLLATDSSDREASLDEHVGDLGLDLIAEHGGVDADVPPPPDLDPLQTDESDRRPDDALAGDEGLDEDTGDSARTTKRHSWSLGPLLRPGSRSKKPDEALNGAEEAAGMPGPPQLDDVAAALAGAAQGRQGQDESPESDLRSMSSDVADEIDAAGSAKSVDDDDLDAIGDLISRAVTDFDPKDVARPSAVAEAGKAGPDDSGEQAPSWSLIDLPDEESSKEDEGDDTSGSARGNGVLTPPSVFNEGDDPFASLDRFEAVTIRPEAEDFGLPESPVKAGPGRFGDAATDALDSGGADDEPKRARRQIEIPADLLDDEVELARHVVSSPDVVLLVDGDSVAKMGWPSLPVAQQRDALVSYLADLASSTGAAPDVVFDGRIGEEESLPASRAVRIRLSTPPTEPAAALDELVDAYPEQWPIAVVTDDGSLSASAVDRGAVVLNNGQLLDLFIAQ